MNAEEPDFLRTARASYDTLAPDYAAHVPDGPATRPLDRALVTAFADLVRMNSPAPVADLGCGPGHGTARLHALGVPVFGVDVSPRMVALARRTHPELRFHVGTMTALDLPPRTLGGIAALHSVSHVPTEHLSTVFAEFERILVPGGQVLLSFPAGTDDRTRLTERFGHDVELDYYWHAPDTVTGHLARTGLLVHARALLDPDEEGTDEDGKRERAFLLARKPPAGQPKRPAT
ncbi:class I SAM-dependent DNA methyltransferase [Streptomyces glomeratus]|uniref:Class I SAM-dependent methyltransferase n=1 Tax=Streptomyces glomeratus TaxID=284452 RepID=A0ABP6L5N2_9ACTN|nr:class I SAM-dependent methyltransferase [Streptomyces glomeratus]MCF1507249.1 class I SAM-dependent methyltransferase [Streptomyces glomeratus]